jgi:alpha-beta hydrolase superfamily lysophospholipase
MTNAIENLSGFQIVLIAHSMGGLVCMRYILDQLENGEAPAIIGLLLYGTPESALDFHP